MSSTTAPASIPARVVAGFVLVIDALLLLVAGWFTIATWHTLSEPGDHGLAGLGYFFAMVAAGLAIPSLPFAIAAVRARGQAAVVCALLAVAALVVPALWLFLGW